MRWDTERLFDGKLCQEYLYQKLSESDHMVFKLQSKMLGMFFGTQCCSISGSSSYISTTDSVGQSQLFSW